MAQMDGLIFDIDARTGNASKTLDDLSASLERLQKAVSSGFKANTANNIKKLNDALSNINAGGANRKIAKLEKALSALSSASNIKISPTIAKRIGEIGQAASSITPDQINKINQLASALQNLGSVSNIKVPSLGGPGIASPATPTQTPAAHNPASNPAQGAAVTQTPAQVNPAAVQQQTSLSQKLADVLAAVQSRAGAAAGAIGGFAGKILSLGGNLEPLVQNTLPSFLRYSASLPMMLGSRLAGSIKSVTSGLGGMFSGLVRIAKFRLFRTIIKLFTEGLSQGINNLYEWSRAAGTSFAPSLDRIATSANYLKNSLGAMASPLIESLAPALDFITDKVVAVFNTVNQLIARITGKTTYTAARKVATTWKEAASDAGSGAADAVQDATDKIKRLTLGFDELNVLSKTKEGSGGSGSGGGSGGSGGSSSGGGDLFEQLPIDSDIVNFVDMLKEKWETGDWEGLGREMGAKVNDLINGIQWGQLGTNVGKAIDAGVKLAYGFIDEVDFRNLGNKISEFLNNGLEEIDFSYVGRLLVSPFLAAADLIIGVFEDLDFNRVGKSIHDFCTGIFDEITGWFNEHDWKDLGNTFYNKIKDLWEGLELGEIATSFWTMLGTEVRSAAEFVEGFFEGCGKDIKKWWKEEIEGETWTETAENLWDALEDGLAKYNPDNIYMTYIVDPFMNGLLGKDTWSGIKGTGATIYNEWVKAVELSFKDPAKAIDDYIVTPIANVLGLGETWQSIKDTGKNIMEGLTKGIDDFFKDPAGWVKEHIVDPLVDNVESLFKIGSPSKVMEDIGNDIMQGLLNGIVGVFAEPAKWIKEHILNPMSDALADAKLALEVGLEKAKNWASDVWEFLQNTGSTIKKTVSAALEKAGTWAQDAWDAIKSGAQTIQKKVTATVEKGATWVSDAWDAVKTGAGTVSRTLNQAVNKGSTWVSDAWDAVKTGGGTVARTLSQGVSKASTWVADAWTAAKTGAGTVSRTLSQAVNKGTWSDYAYSAAYIGGGNVSRSLTQAAKKGSWSDYAYSAAYIKNGNVSRTLKQAAKKGSWSDYAYAAAYIGKGNVSRTLTQTAKKGSNWSDYAYTAAFFGGGSISRKLTQTCKKGEWSDHAYSALWYGANTGSSIKKKLKISVSWVGSKLKTAWALLASAFGVKANGGIFVNGTWGNIPQYASGGVVGRNPGNTDRNRHGSLFLAGEAGPEIVGHVGGRTEVLNKSQLASTMYSAVIEGMRATINPFAQTLLTAMQEDSNALINAQLYNGSMITEALASSDTMTTTDDTTDDSVTAMSAAMAFANDRQNALLREQNDLLRRLLDKDTRVEVTTKSITNAMNRQNRRDGRTIIPVSG